MSYIISEVLQFLILIFLRTGLGLSSGFTIHISEQFLSVFSIQRTMFPNISENPSFNNNKIFSSTLPGQLGVVNLLQQDPRHPCLQCEPTKTRQRTNVQTQI